MSRRLTPERLTKIRRVVEFDRTIAYAAELLAELDAVTRERDMAERERDALIASLSKRMPSDSAASIEAPNREDASTEQATREAQDFGFCGKPLGRPGWVCTRPADHERNLTPCHAVEAWKLDAYSAARRKANCPKCHGSGLLPISGQKIPCDHVVKSDA